MGCDFHELAECRHWSASCLASGVLEPYHQHDIWSTWNHHWRCSAVSSVTRIPDSVPLAPLMTTSPMHQSQSWRSSRTPEPIVARFITVRAFMCLPKRRIICTLRRGAEMKQFILTIRSNKWRSSRGVIIISLPPDSSDPAAPAVYCAAGPD